jgi:hypothetical protein
MFKNAHSATRLLISILVALSGLGAIVAGQQYLFLQSEKEIMLARRTVDESFLSAIRVAGGESNPEIAQQLARRQTSIEGTYSGEAAMIRQLEIRAMADTIAWFVVIVLSGLALTINWRKQARSGDPPAASMK